MSQQLLGHFTAVLVEVQALTYGLSIIEITLFDLIW
jgi:hypothetical protein